MKEKLVHYRPGVDPEPVDESDWARVDRMTDEEIEAAALSDPDAQPMSEEELARMFRPGALRELRKGLGLSQAEFGERFRINLRTQQDWEQGRRVPGEVARNYLRVIARDPKFVAAALEA
jgi:putative transcriptional regulator